MSIKKTINAALSWMDKGSTTLSFIKGATVIGTIFSIVLVPTIYYIDQQYKRINNRPIDLDSRPTAIFNSVTGCVKKGYPEQECQKSQKIAHKIEKYTMHELSYSSMLECSKKHQGCTEVDIGSFVIHKMSYPPVVAWQAAANDLNISLPLYAGPQKETAVRSDGKQFNLN